MTRKNKSFIHASNKKARRNWDAEKLDYLQENIGLPTIREREIHDRSFSTQNKIRIPDLTVRGKPEIIIEHDTFNIHGELSDPNERTQKRNVDYARAGRLFVIINEDLCKILGLDEAKLARYLVEHEKAHFLAQQAVREVLT